MSTPDPVEQPRLLTPQEFLSRAQLTSGLDAWIDEQLALPDVTERSMLRVTVFLMHAIAHSMPWDEGSGLDARRTDVRSGELLPTWRECLGAILGVKFSRGEGAEG